MKRFLIATLMIATIVVVGSTGCSKKVTPLEQNPEKDSGMASSSDTNDKGNQRDRGQRQMNRADLSGEIVSVKGNDVELKLIEIPQMGQRDGAKPNNDDKTQSQGDNANGNKQQDKGNGGGRGQMQRQIKYTGETKTITIAAETAITSFGRGGMGGPRGGQNRKNNDDKTNNENGSNDNKQQPREPQKLEVKDLKQGEIVQVWYKDKEKGVIDRISVMPSFNGQNQKAEDKAQ